MNTLCQNYVDGFVLVVPKDKIEEYKKMAEDGRDTWMKYGALHYYECRGDDFVPQEMGKKAEEYKDMLMPFDMKRMAYGGFGVEVEG